VRRPLLTAAIALAALTTGCGAERQAAPDPNRPLPPDKFGRAVYTGPGVAFEAPLAWPRSTGNPPLVATITSGRATIAVWRYPRREPLPVTRGELRPLVKALVEAARARDRTLSVETSRIVRVGRLEGIEIVGTETINGQRRRVRSVHVFDRKAEVVVDAFAPPAEFDALNRRVFQPVISSLIVTNPAGQGQSGQGQSGQGQPGQGGQRRP